MVCAGLRSLMALGVAVAVCGCGSGDKSPDSTAPSTTLDAHSESGKSVAQQLGLDERTAGPQSIDAVISGSGYSLIGGIITPFKALPLDARGGVVHALAKGMRSYYQSSAFKQDYLTLRAQRKPVPPEYERTPQQELDAALAADRKQLQEARTSVLPMLPENSRAEVEESYKQNEKMLADPEMQKYRLMGIEAERQQRQADFESALQKWKDTYPEDPQPIIARRLTEFLALTEGIDFDAKLVDAGGKKKFANPEYEGKSWDWKWSFRAGKDSVSAARDVAKSWLSDIE